MFFAHLISVLLTMSCSIKSHCDLFYSKCNRFGKKADGRKIEIQLNQSSTQTQRGHTLEMKFVEVDVKAAVLKEFLVGDVSPLEGF